MVKELSQLRRMSQALDGLTMLAEVARKLWHHEKISLVIYVEVFEVNMS